MYILFSDLLSYKGKLGEENFKWQAKIQKDEREEEKSIEGGESIYSCKRSGVSTQEFGILFIFYQFLKNRVMSQSIMFTLGRGLVTLGGFTENRYASVEITLSGKRSATAFTKRRIGPEGLPSSSIMAWQAGQRQ